jgi:hypothetical protein
LILPIIRSDITIPQKLKPDTVAIGLRKFEDSGLSDDLIPIGMESSQTFKKLKSIDPPKTILPELLELIKIIRTVDGTKNN